MINKEGVKHIFFDLDHTLWDFDRNSALAFEIIFKKNGLDINIDDFLTTYSPINFNYWKYYREDRITKSQLRYGRFRKTFDALHIKVTDDIIHKLATDYITYLPSNNYLFDNTIEVLEQLSQNYKLHIITNGFEEVQNLKLQNSNIAHYFEVIMTSEKAGVKKPFAPIFEKAMEEAQAKAVESIMVGDTYEADIVGAENIGMQTICFNYHKQVLPETNVVVTRLIDILSLL